MEVLNETATHNGGLETRPAPEALRPFVEMFVHRNETVDGNVVRVLPETRSSVQFRLANPYWVRKRAAASVWQRVPDISIWAPRHKWGYGFANAQVRVFAFSLTPAGIQALFDQPISAYVDTILDASEFYCFQTLTKVELGDSFQTWVARMSKALMVFFENADPTPPVSNNALEMLATISSGSVAKAAMMEGLSPRQFRRRFTRAYGLGPKQYQRLIRVDRQMRQLHPAPWERDSFEPAPVPFSDQPHSIREFRDTIGTTPLQYKRCKQGADQTLRSITEPDISPPNHASHSSSV